MYIYSLDLFDRMILTSLVLMPARLQSIRTMKTTTERFQDLNLREVRQMQKERVEMENFKSRYKLFFKRFPAFQPLNHIIG